MKINEILKRLDAIVFHDIPVESIQLHGVDPDIELIITILIYNQHTEEYDKLEIRFKEVIEMELGTLLLKSNSEMEIYRFDYFWDEEFSANMLLLFGFGQPSAELKLKCKVIELKHL